MEWKLHRAQTDAMFDLLSLVLCPVTDCMMLRYQHKNGASWSWFLSNYNWILIATQRGKGVSFDWSSFFFFNHRLFPSLLKQKLNIIAWDNACDSIEKPFSDRSIPSKIKLTNVRSTIGTDWIWFASSNLKLASTDGQFKHIACLMGPTVFTSDSKKLLGNLSVIVNSTIKKHAQLVAWHHFG